MKKKEKEFFESVENQPYEQIRYNQRNNQPLYSKESNSRKAFKFDTQKQWETLQRRNGGKEIKETVSYFTIL